LNQSKNFKNFKQRTGGRGGLVIDRDEEPPPSSQGPQSRKTGPTGLKKKS
jgi:hypothetical protein